VDWRGLLGRVAAVAVGLAWGFFGALNIVFSDAGSRAEFLQALATVAAVYFGLAFVAGVLAPRTGWMWGVWIAIPGLVLLAVYVLLESAALINAAIVGCASVFAACAGAALGGLIRRPRTQVS
jgi:hypothetical protein